MAKVVIADEDLKKMQRRGLEMVLYFDAFCKEQGLTWFLCGGCCIGAIRNGGFIPWDDDVDVFMPREDYEKLKRLWRDTPDYAIQYPTREQPTQNQFVTICDNNTTFIKSYQKDLDIRHGLMLDILPLDGCPTGWRRALQKFWALLYSLFVVGKAPTNHGSALTYLGKFLLGLVPWQELRYRIWRFCEGQMTRYPISDCNYITELCSGPHYMQLEYPREYFSDMLRVSFEDRELPVPVGYDGYLRMAFGDYMQLPPEEKRVNHHEYEYLDMDRPYSDYRGIYYFRKEVQP